MPFEWALCIVIPIIKGKGDIRQCNCNRAVNLLEHKIKLVKRVLEKWLRRIVTVDEKQFGLMLERGTIDAVFLLRMMQKEYHANGEKNYMCFVEKAAD